MIDRLLEYVPFVVLSTGKPHLNFSKIAEALIIAIVAGGLSAYITVQKLDLRLQYLEGKVDKLYSDVYKPSWNETIRR